MTLTAARRDEIEEFLSYAINNYQHITKLSNYSYHFINVPEIDTELQKIGGEILQINHPNLKINFDENSITFVTTILSKFGGGTRMIEDWVKKYQSFGMNCNIIVTSPTSSDQEIVDKFSNSGVKVYNCTGKNIYELIENFQNYMISCASKQVFLCSFAMDLVAISGLQKNLLEKLYLNLVLDHGISTGLHIPYIDKILCYRPYLINHISEYIKIAREKFLYIPLSKTDTVADLHKGRQYMKNGYIITASSTSYRYKISDNYKYKYVDVVVGILKNTKGKHIHIGDIGDDQVKYIKSQLKKNNLKTEMFEVIKYTSCLAKTLIAENVDILIQTFPSGGGLTSVEAMQSGTSIISHVHAYSYLYNASDMIYDEVFFWKEPQELYQHISTLTKADIEKEGKISRKFFEEDLNVDSLFTKNEIFGKKFNEQVTKEKFSYSLDYFFYLKECYDNLPNLEPVVIEKKSRLKKKLKKFEKEIIRPFFRLIFGPNFRKKVRKFFGLKEKKS